MIKGEFPVTDWTTPEPNDHHHARLRSSYNTQCSAGTLLLLWLLG